MQNSEDIMTVVDREPIFIDSMSVHQNYGGQLLTKACRRVIKI
jgi:hypothetical protein